MALTLGTKLHARSRVNNGIFTPTNADRFMLQILSKRVRDAFTVLILKELQIFTAPWNTSRAIASFVAESVLRQVTSFFAITCMKGRTEASRPPTAPPGTAGWSISLYPRALFGPEPTPRRPGTPVGP